MSLCYVIGILMSLRRALDALNLLLMVCPEMMRNGARGLVSLPVKDVPSTLTAWTPMAIAQGRGGRAE